MLPKNILEKKFLIITHTYATGPSQELRDYFLRNKAIFAFLEHPFMIDKNSQNSTITYYEKGIEIKKIKGGHTVKTDWLCFVKDFIETILLTIKLGKKFDICIAADNLNTISALFLKKIGFVRKVIYYAIDYSPKRFDIQILNKIYLSVDKYCCYWSNLVWSSSERMKLARIKSGVDERKYSPELIVRDGCHFNSIVRLPEKKIDRKKIVFMGHLVPNKGVDLILKSFPRVLREAINAKLIIIGGGSEENNLKRLANELKISKHIVFTGFIDNHEEVEKIIASCGIAVAPYVPDKNSFTFFSDVGKVKVYLACGLPVLITDVPEISQQIEKNKAGKIIQYDKNDLSDKMIDLIVNEDMYLNFRRNAIIMAKDLDWDNVWKKSLTESYKLLYK